MKKYIALTTLMVTMIIGGLSQIMAWSDTPLEYNAYVQIVIGFGLFIYLVHKMISYYEARNAKTIVNKTR